MLTELAATEDDIEHLSETAAATVLVGIGAVLLCYIASLVGMMLLRQGALWLFIASIVGLSLRMVFQGHLITSGPALLFSMVELISAGMIIAIGLFTDVLPQHQKRNS